MSFQWQFNGTNLLGATNLILAITNAESANAGDYRIILTNAYGSATSAVATLTITYLPPSILSQPGSNLVVNVGDSASFSVTAAGSPSLSYQWRTNGVALVGATSMTLVLTSVPNQAGNYDVVVSSPYGSITSSVAVLTVNRLSQTITFAALADGPLGDPPFNLEASASSGLPVSYSSSRPAVATISGSTVTLVSTGTTIITASQGGDATWLAAPTVGRTLTVSMPPNIIAQPVSQTVNVGQNASFTVTATGYQLNYQWRKEGIDISGATEATLSLGIARSNHAGSYTVVVSNGLGSVTSAPPAVLTVNSATPAGVVAWGWNNYGQTTVPQAAQNEATAIAAGLEHSMALAPLPPSITVQPVSQTVNVGQNASFTVSATGSAPLGYQWRKDGANLADGGNISGATSTNLLLTGVTTNDAGNYTVVVSNSVGSITSAPPAVLAVNRLSQTITFPALTNRLVGDAPFTLQGSASSGLPVSYSSSNPGVATVSGNTVTLVAAGTTTITASQAGDATWLPAAPVSRVLIVVNAMRFLPPGYWPDVSLIVTISVVPPAGTTVYAVEDSVPVEVVPVLIPVYYNAQGVPIAWQMSSDYTNWTVTAISHGGEFDATTFRVKYGPFFDDSPRTLSYQLIPPAGVTNSQLLSGTVSIDGITQSVSGNSQLSLLPLHPADNNLPADRVLTIDEITAYAAAWKRGQLWSVGPNPIPIGYMTRAGFLWKNGENYIYDPTVTNTPPLWWVNVFTNQTPQFRAVSVASASLDDDPVGNTAVCQMTNRYTPGVPFRVTISVAPASNIAVYAVEDRIPNGWTATNITNGGIFNVPTGKVKWGPFFDNSARTLTYDVTPPANAQGTGVFDGSASLDGSSVAITGQRQVTSDATAPARLGQFSFSPQTGFRLTLTGEAGISYILEASTNLAHWIPLLTNSFSGSNMVLIDPTATNFNHRFYRARLEP